MTIITKVIYIGKKHVVLYEYEVILLLTSEIKKCAIFNKTFFFPCIEWVKVPRNIWLYLRIQLSVYKAFRRHLLGLIVGRPVLD